MCRVDVKPLLTQYNAVLTGCMAERLKSCLLEQSSNLVDVVCGPDAYRDLPRLLSLTDASHNAGTPSVSLSVEFLDSPAAGTQL